MHHLLITNIGRLCLVEKEEEKRVHVAGKDMATVSSIENAWLYIEDHNIHSYGRMSDMDFFPAENVYDAEGRTILPTWVDSHTHLVFAAPREQEFVDRIKGLSYEDIARKGGGILNSARRLNDISEEELFDQSLHRLHQVIATGTGTIEIKSGYGLSLYSELKMLRVIRRLKECSPIPIRATFLAAHAYPLEYKQDHEGYLKLIIDEMLPQVQDEGLADYMDVFCEEGFFSRDETSRLLEAGWKYGLKPKIHANQLHISGGVQTGIRHKAVSVDHLECVGEEEIEALRNSKTIPTLLPAAAFFLGMHYQPARKLIDAGLPVALATDYNPGSCPSGNIPLLLTIACTQLKMTPEEAINAVTLNGAAALEMSNEVGSIAAGKRANLIVTKHIPSLAYIPYDFGNNPVEKMVINGVFL
jgi:imidazolonepropionase